MSCSIDANNCPEASFCPVGSLFTYNNPLGTCSTCTTTTVVLEGYYCNQGVVQLCPAGFYCPFVASSEPIECPDGYICRDGYSAPVECSKLSTCDAGVTSKSTGPGFVVILALIGAITFATLWFLDFLRRRKAKKALSASEKHNHVKRAFAEVLQSVTGAASTSNLMQGFNEKIRYSSPVSIEFENLGMSLKLNGAVVLEGVTGEFPPGSLVAVMGGSGAGKSTFMNALANRAPYGNIIGKVSLNKVPGETIGKYPRLVGFVPQDDIMHDDLTVYENLMYSARLRLPPSMSIAQQRAIVEDVIEILDLGRIRDNVVGNPEKRGISGGQKKRVNIGMELVAYPRVLFLDEPTSGLDSASSLQVARCLQRMRSLGITVVTVIHQPRWSVFRCFSHCLLLAKGGKTAYLGSTGFIQGYFEKCGFVIPGGENVADWFIDIVSGQSVRHLEQDGAIDNDFVPERDLPKIWTEKGKQIIEALATDKNQMARAASMQVGSSVESIEEELSGVLKLSGPETEVSPRDIARLCKKNGVEANADTVVALHAQFANSVPNNGKLTLKSLALVLFKNSQEDLAKSSSGSATDEANRKGSGEKLVNREGQSFMSQLNTLVSRNMAKFNTKDLLTRCLVAVIGSVVVTFSTKGEMDYSLIPANFQSGLLLFSIIAGASFMYVFGDEKLIFTREGLTGFSITAYWLAKNIVNILDVVIITLYYYTFYFAIMQLDYSFAQGLGTFVLLAWYCAGISNFFSVTMGNANGLLIAVLMPAIEISILSGIKPTMSTATGFQQGLNYIGIGYYSVEDMTLVEVRSLPENVQNIPDITAMMSLYAYDQNHLTRNSIVSLCLGIAVRLCTLAALFIKVHGWPGALIWARLKRRFA